MRVMRSVGSLPGSCETKLVAYLRVMGANRGMFSGVHFAVAYITAKVVHVLKHVQLVNFSSAETFIIIVNVCLLIIIIKGNSYFF